MKVAQLTLAIFVLILNLNCLFGLEMTTQQANLNEQKIKKLQELANESENGLINIKTAAMFDKYVYQFPRQYDIVVFFTAGNCNWCDQMENEYAKVAGFYEANGHLTEKKTDDEEVRRPVFFTRIQYNESMREMFIELEFQSVPDIMVSLPNTATANKLERREILKPNKWHITQTDGHVQAQKILDYVNKRLELNIEYIVPLSDRLTNIFAMVSAVAFIAFLFFYCQALILSPKFWFVGSFIIYVVCCSGIVYNVLNDTPLFHGNEWYSKQQRMQYGIEGYIMSASIGFAAILFIIINKLHEIVSSEILIRMAYMSLFLGLFIVLSFIERIYREKGWYNPLFFPPAHYIQGSYLNDQGNTI